MPVLPVLRATSEARVTCATTSCTRVRSSHARPLLNFTFPLRFPLSYAQLSQEFPGDMGDHTYPDLLRAFRDVATPRADHEPLRLPPLPPFNIFDCPTLPARSASARVNPSWSSQTNLFGSTTTQHSLPPELVPRILSIVALDSPHDFLSCLLTCKAWNSALSSPKYRFLVMYNFLETKELPHGLIFHNDKHRYSEDIGYKALDNTAYAMWSKLGIAYLRSEFGFVSASQANLVQEANVPITAGSIVPKDDSEWRQLAEDIEFCKINNDPGFPYAYNMICPFIISPAWEEENTNSIAKDADLLKKLLPLLRVSKHLQKYYELRRFPVANIYQIIGYIVEHLYGIHGIDFQHRRRFWALKAAHLYAAMEKADVVEVIHIMARADDVDAAEKFGGWRGQFSRFTLCRRRDPARNVLGWLIYDDSNLEPA
ncbi:uncharacterized protein EV422DRAFT_236409 [Fimicolochytrium jonesii]|uniref:uncharacterized protein n=1 Tax=Fimicolochytrium jonesii TaxID=1396493 RepID=UPI0022FE181A|nr:uncharacterized protein EV422DRAFT_236409 [Fimicolochytrium jonesii]KAI8824869.1 hypothetical protein EV422DRAFT_236409 [Fimicolochytrium jonesii]